jgi:hypothetical protein
MLNDNGRFRELPSWRKAFKHDWKKAAKTPITMPLNDKYRPDSRRWVCTCPHFRTSRFLLCKHLVQSVHPVPPEFFLEVRRNRTTPFWKHKKLIPIDEPTSDAHTSAFEGQGTQNRSTSDESGDEGDESDDGVVDTESGIGEGRTVRERMSDHISMLRDFANGLEYQLQFNDRRMLDNLEREGRTFIQFAQTCLSRERRMNSTRGSSPTTWEKESASAMFYRTRPTRREINT